MKIFYRLVFIPVAAIFVVFAVANRHTLTLDLWPLPLEIDLPVYIAVLGALAVGMAVGGSAKMDIGRQVRRRSARADKRKASALERRLTLVEAAREAEDGTGERPPNRRRRVARGCPGSG